MRVPLIDTSTRADRGSYIMGNPAPISLPIHRYYTVPLYEVKSFNMHRTNVDYDVPESSSFEVNRTLVPPSYCQVADHTQPNHCRMRRKGEQDS